ncbi:chemotaxis protein CheA [Serpentinicella sp. ANB-PHB4]|uniref:chemotaxis protein CheA n=1 Tax=Serpentinicella sp. ANB-PHB4 TaxID=3074076 RepID=UPI002861D617|nr:chemotaxis protein CheA [Serpentinicella sp. ANB-PHB4]MDR5658484.1 chemotaxis protein CheA [Serpentinicella sp. ANB-PHB4]
MYKDFDVDAMLSIFVFETSQLIESLEEIIIQVEDSNNLNEYINEIFRVMHTIKGSSTMMGYESISTLSHTLEDLFFIIRDRQLEEEINNTELADITLKFSDFIKKQIQMIENGEQIDTAPEALIKDAKDVLNKLKGTTSSPKEMEQKTDQTNNGNIGQLDNYSALEDTYWITLFFEEDAGMENVRAFSVVHQLSEIVNVLSFIPETIASDSDTAERIIKEGFKIKLEAGELREIEKCINSLSLIKEYIITPVEEATIEKDNKLQVGQKDDRKSQENKTKEPTTTKKSKNKMISVDVNKLDSLMDLVGELVLAESMVSRNPEVANLNIESFSKATTRLRKIIHDTQQEVMSIRMVTLSQTFQKMKRLVRDMGKKTNKKVEIVTRGEEVEVDKNVIEFLSDPLLHIIRNAVDHGIESPKERLNCGKAEEGKITLEAKNVSGDVVINIIDDGKGLDRDKILNKALDHGLVDISAKELTDKEVYAFIFLPGFSTKDNVSEFSGRGVGMDVVNKNIEQVRGRVAVDSTSGKGTTISIKIPLTLAVIDGMIINVGVSKYIIPTMSINHSICIKEDEIIKDTDGNEMLLIRNQALPILRLHHLYKTEGAREKISEGVIIIVESDKQMFCVFADELAGQQQIVVKELPEYIKGVKAVAGCTLLGDGSVSLILDVNKLTDFLDE